MVDKLNKITQGHPTLWKYASEFFNFMTFKSTAQIAKFKDMEAKGHIKAGTTEQWMAETPNPQRLPQRTKPKKPTRTKKNQPYIKSDLSWYK